MSKVDQVCCTERAQRQNPNTHQRNRNGRFNASSQPSSVATGSDGHYESVFGAAMGRQLENVPFLSDVAALPDHVLHRTARRAIWQGCSPHTAPHRHATPHTPLPSAIATTPGARRWRRASRRDEKRFAIKGYAPTFARLARHARSRSRFRVVPAPGPRCPSPAAAAWQQAAGRQRSCHATAQPSPSTARRFPQLPDACLALISGRARPAVASQKGRTALPAVPAARARSAPCAGALGRSQPRRRTVRAVSQARCRAGLRLYRRRSMGRVQDRANDPVHCAALLMQRLHLRAEV